MARFDYQRYTDPAQMADLVERIQKNDAAAEIELYELCQRGRGLQLMRMFSYEDRHDICHEVYSIALPYLRSGSLREPARLLGFVRVLMHRQVAACINRLMVARKLGPASNSDVYNVYDKHPDPERTTLIAEKSALMRECLSKMKAKPREILMRFYVQEESQATIREAMHLTATQYRLLKSRAKADLTEAVSDAQRSKPVNFKLAA